MPFAMLPESFAEFQDPCFAAAFVAVTAVVAVVVAVAVAGSEHCLWVHPSAHPACLP